jgi:hypothetical protein
MCKAILAFVLLLQVVPSPVLAQDASATDWVEQLSAARFELATSSANAARPWPPRVLHGAVLERPPVSPCRCPPRGAHLCRLNSRPDNGEA